MAESNRGGRRGALLGGAALATLIGLVALVSWMARGSQESAPDSPAAAIGSSGDARTTGLAPESQPGPQQALTAPALATDGQTALEAESAGSPPTLQSFAVSGRLLDPRGDPVAGATIWLVPSDRGLEAAGVPQLGFHFDLDWERLSSVLSATDGRFVISGEDLPPDATDLAAQRALDAWRFPKAHRDADGGSVRITVCCRGQAGRGCEPSAARIPVRVGHRDGFEPEGWAGRQLPRRS